MFALIMNVLPFPKPRNKNVRIDNFDQKNLSKYDKKGSGSKKLIVFFCLGKENHESYF